MGWSAFELVVWAADGKSLYVNGWDRRSSYPALLHVDLKGEARVLRQKENEWHVYPAPSPDGRYLAFARMPFHGNVWTIENFGR